MSTGRSDGGDRLYEGPSETGPRALSRGSELGYVPRVWFGVLGQLEVRRADGSPVRISGPARRQVLAALLCRPGAVVHTSTLVDDLWGSAVPRSAIGSLRSHVTRLRDDLGQDSGVLVTQGDGYRLDVGPGDVDAAVFQQLVEEAAQAPEHREAIGQYDAALALWRNEAYLDFGEAAFAVAERIRLAELRALARERRTELALAAGMAAELIGDLEERVRAEPYRERGWQQLALALYRSGRQADALAAFRRVREVLGDDLGVEPGRELRDLEIRILQQDDELIAPPPRQIDVVDTVGGRCPYLGLASYEESDAALFVGRERLTSVLAGRLSDQSVVVVTGPSGVGKSSLVRAGLIPALRAGALPGSSAWRVDVRTGADGIGLGHDDGKRPDLIVLDQAEELFTNLDSAQREEIVAKLARFVEDEDGRLLVVLRSDFYGRLAELDRLAPFELKGAVLVGPMRTDELRRALVEPAAKAGLVLAAELLEMIMDDVAGQSEPLPLLSEAMLRTWERREGNVLTLDAYRRSGELSGALEAAAEECFARLTETQRQAARHLLVRMAARTPNGWTRRAVDVQGSGALSEGESQARAALVAARLVVASDHRMELAHDALLVHWPRLRGWLDERTMAADLVDHVDRAASAWKGSGRQRTDLYRGPRLSAALDWRADHPEDLSPSEHEFLNASAAAADEELEVARAQTAREAKGRRRLRSVAIALTAVVIVAAATAVIAVHERSSARRAAARAQHAALLADARRLAALSVNAPDTATGALLSEAAYQLDDSPDTRSALLTAVERRQSALWRIQTPERLFHVFATPGNSVVATTNSHVVEIVDPMHHKLMSRVAMPAGYDTLDGITSDGRCVIVSGTADRSAVGEGRVAVLTIATNELRRLDAVASLNGPWPTTTSDGTFITFVTTRQVHHNSVIDVFDSRNPARPPRHFLARGYPAALASGTTAVAVENADGSVDVRSLRSLRPAGQVAATSTKPAQSSLAVSPDGSRVARVDPKDAGKVTVYRTQVGGSGSRLPTQPSDVTWMAFAPSGTQLAVGSGGGSLVVYRSSDGALSLDFPGNGGQLLGLGWSGVSTPTALYSAGLDGQLISWDVSLEPRLVGETGPDFPAPVHLTLFGSHVLGDTGGGDVPQSARQLLEADLRQGIVRTLPAGMQNTDNGLSGISTSHDGRIGLETIVDRLGANRSVIWDLRAQKPVGRLSPPPGTGRSTNGYGSLVGPDGRLAYVTLSRTRIGIFALPSGRYLRSISVHFAADPGRIIAQPWDFDPSGRLVVFGEDPNGPNNRLGLVDLGTGTLIAQVVLGDIQLPTALGWSPDGRLLAAGMWNGSLALYDARSFTPRAQLAAVEPGAVNSVSFSPDGTTLATTGDGGALDLWTVSGLDREARITIGDGRVFAWYNPVGRLVGVAPDTTRPGSGTNRWFVLRSDPASLVAEACVLAGGGMTRAQWQRYVGDRPFRALCPASR